MMEQINLNTLLFAGKWVLISLVYFFLIIIVITVRREITYRTTGKERPAAVTPGRLKVINAGSDTRIQPGNILPLKQETRLGAETDNDLILSDQYVSKHHACLRWDGAAWWIEDLGSSNGTTVDGHICPPQNPQPIKGGASMQLGDMIFELMV